MNCRSCLDNRTASVVADTSVIINLNATGRAEAILRALPNRLVVVEEVLLELREGRQKGWEDADALSDLIARQIIKHARLGNSGMRHFALLVAGSAAQTLDDGEAATIACALQRNAIALVDERKAIRICTERFPNLVTGCTVDVLAQKDVRVRLTDDGLANATFNALDRGRMRVPDRYGKWIIDIIGQERAAKCHSLSERFRSGGSSLSE